MRKIKFRIWDKIEKVFLEGGDKSYALDLLLSKDEETEDVFRPAVAFNLDKYELSQFTGFIGKNNEEIFEGDIIKVEFADGMKEKFLKLIIWSNDGLWWAAELDGTNKKQGVELYMHPHSRCQIVGNIFENPELLK